MQAERQVQGFDRERGKQYRARARALELKDAYLALRRIEHALQYESDRQTQRLPNDGATRERVVAVVKPYILPAGTRRTNSGRIPIDTSWLTSPLAPSLSSTSYTFE